MSFSQLQSLWPPLIAAGLALSILLVARWVYGIKVHLLALLLGGLLLAVMPIDYALAHKVSWKYVSYLQLTHPDIANAPIIRNLYRLVPQVFFIGITFGAGYVVAGFSKGDPILHTVVLSLLYPLAVTASCSGVSAIGGLRLEVHVFLGGPEMPMVLLVLSLSLLGAVYNSGIRSSIIILSFHFFLVALLAMLNLDLDSRLEQLSATIAKQPLEAELLAQPPDQEFLMAQRPRLTKGPFRYTGFHNFNGIAVWGQVKRCEDGAAVIGAVDVSSDSYVTADRLAVKVDCALMPDIDLLTNQHQYADLRCPSGFVATSGTQASCHRQECGDSTKYPHRNLSKHCSNCPQQIRCTRINENRYQLGPEHIGVFWGISRQRWREKLTVQKAELPQAAKYGLGRFNYQLSTFHGCIGNPFGSVLVAKTGSRCHQYFFRQLQYRGIPGDPPQGTAVPIFPDCIDAGENSSELDCEQR